LKHAVRDKIYIDPKPLSNWCLIAN
jgi:hypothetical protein